MKRKIILKISIMIIIIIVIVIGLFVIINRKKMKRKTNEISDTPESYSLNYIKHFDLMYNQKKDMGIDLIYKTEKYTIETFGGDVEIIKQNKIYSLNDALINNIITFNDILEQIELDKKYGLCNSSGYSNDGSIEYLYEDYTILEINQPNGNTNLIIGMKGSIIEGYKANKDDLKESRNNYLKELDIYFW